MEISLLSGRRQESFIRGCLIVGGGSAPPEVQADPIRREIDDDLIVTLLL